MQRVYDKARAIFCDFIDKIPGILVIHHFMCTARLHNECRSGKGVFMAINGRGILISFPGLRYSYLLE